MKAPGLLYRVARRPHPWTSPDWSAVAPDGTFGNRFDDPESTYRVLYASSRPLGCFLETLARFRPDPMLAAELAKIAGMDDFHDLGTIPPSWVQQRCLGSAQCAADFADIGSAKWLARIRRKLAPVLAGLGFAEFDAAALHRSEPRRLTQMVSRLAFNAGAGGVRYLSKFGSDVENWAIFEPFDLKDTTAEALRLGDPDLQAALRIHGLRWQG